MSAGRTALTQMLVSRLVALAAMTVGFAVLGRLLSPADFGYFAIAAAAFQAVKGLANFGLRQYIIRSEEELDPTTLSSAAGLSLAIAAAGCIAFLAAPWIPGGLIAPQIAWALAPLGVALLAGPLILGVEVQLQKAMAFRLPAYAAIAASMSEIAVAIGMALCGLGVSSLALGLMTSEIVSALVLVLFAPVAYRTIPRMRRGDKVGIYLGFGGRLTLINLLPNLVALVLVSCLGALAGPAATGLYNRSKTVLDLLDRIVFDGVGPVILPMISGALRDGIPPQRVLAMKLDYLSVLCWPALAMIALLAEPLVLLMLGNQWLSAVPAVRLLALSGVALPLTKMSVKFFTAIDALDAYLQIQIVFQIVTLAAGIAGAALSLEMFCAAISLALIFKAACIGIWLHRHFPPENGEVAAAFGRGGVVTCAAVVPAGLLLGTGAIEGIELLLAGGVAAVLGWAAALLVLGHPLLDDLRQVVVLPWRRVAGRLFR